MPRRNSIHNGLLVVDKPGKLEESGPPGPTSHDIVQIARRVLKERRIGHTGTLDPMASGVMVLCVGNATRLVEYYQGHDKQYYAEIALGAATNTYDAVGQVTTTSDVPQLDPQAIDLALDRFRGAILQTPPIYSAIKQDGEALHRKARRGESVTVDPRSVVFHELDLLRYDPADAVNPDRNSASGYHRICLRIRCSAGTYIRSLAHDLGLAVGTYAHLALLRREAAGPFGLADTVTLAQLEEAVVSESVAEYLLPPGYGLPLPQIVLEAEIAKRLGFGQKVVLNSQDAANAIADLDDEERIDDGLTRLAQGVDETGKFVGIMRYMGPTRTDEGDHIWRAEKWFSH